MQNTRPGGSYTTMLSYKSANGATLAIHMHIFKIVCFSDIVNGRFRVDRDAIPGGKHDPRKQGRRIILIYKS